MSCPVCNGFEACGCLDCLCDEHLKQHLDSMEEYEMEEAARTRCSWQNDYRHLGELCNCNALDFDGCHHSSCPQGKADIDEHYNMALDGSECGICGEQGCEQECLEEQEDANNLQIDAEFLHAYDPPFHEQDFFYEVPKK